MSQASVSLSEFTLSDFGAWQAHYTEVISHCGECCQFWFTGFVKGITLSPFEFLTACDAVLLAAWMVISDVCIPICGAHMMRLYVSRNSYSLSFNVNMFIGVTQPYELTQISPLTQLQSEKVKICLTGNRVSGNCLSWAGDPMYSSLIWNLLTVLWACYLVI